MEVGAEREAAGLSQSGCTCASRVPQPNPSASGERSAVATGKPSERVDRLRDAILQIVAAHHASRPRLFGSVGRGEDHPGSDVDLLVDFTEEASLLDEIGLRLALVDLLGVEVDVVAVDTLREPMRQRVLAESVPV